MNLARKIKRNRAKLGLRPTPKPANEKLIACAIMRDGKIWDGGKAHSDIRRRLGDADPYKHVHGDIEGFIVSPGDRFVDRCAAQDVALKAGQLRYRLGRGMLSSDLDW